MTVKKRFAVLLCAVFLIPAFSGCAAGSGDNTSAPPDFSEAALTTAPERTPADFPAPTPETTPPASPEPAAGQAPPASPEPSPAPAPVEIPDSAAWDDVYYYANTDFSQPLDDAVLRETAGAYFTDETQADSFIQSYLRDRGVNSNSPDGETYIDGQTCAEYYTD